MDLPKLPMLEEFSTLTFAFLPSIHFNPQRSTFITCSSLFRLFIRITYIVTSTVSQVNFCNKVYHPNISAKGAVYLNLLKDHCSCVYHFDGMRFLSNICTSITHSRPQIRLLKVLNTICSLLARPRVGESDVFDEHVAQIYSVDKAEYESIARRWPQQYATGN
ncbi:unnamed protein product [Arabis nemorensis]|uniref:UBC core domain-containing protein n=1 Tax=Arabis nemorensis TaxID=586526 RepID=A0A565C9X0_9BRAS|nr:unnamed protein product [Arabis nemorensis]